MHVAIPIYIQRKCIFQKCFDVNMIRFIHYRECKQTSIKRTIPLLKFNTFIFYFVPLRKIFSITWMFSKYNSACSMRNFSLIWFLFLYGWYQEISLLRRYIRKEVNVNIHKHILSIFFIQITIVNNNILYAVLFVNVCSYSGKIIRFLTVTQMQSEWKKYSRVESQDKIPQDIVDFYMKNIPKIWKAVKWLLFYILFYFLCAIWM